MDPMEKDNEGNYLEAGRLYRAYKRSMIGNGYQNKVSKKKFECVLMEYEKSVGMPQAKYDGAGVLLLDADEVVMYLEEEYYVQEEFDPKTLEVITHKMLKFHKILLGEEIYWLYDDKSLVFELVKKEEFH